MPLGLDYGDLAVGAQVSKQIQDQSDATLINELKLRQALHDYKMQSYQDPYTIDQMPLKFAAERAGLVQESLPINWERLNNIVGDGGLKLLAESLVNTRNLNNRDPKKVDPNAYKIETNPYPQPSPEQVGSDVKSALGAATGSPAKPLKLQVKSRNRGPQSVDDRDPDSVESGQTAEQAAQTQAATQEMQREAYQQPRSPYSMDTASLMQMLGRVDPTAYLGKQELALSEKMIGAEAEKQALALRNMNQAAMGKSKMEQDYEAKMAELQQKYFEAKDESSRDLIKSMMHQYTEQFKSIMDVFRPRGSGGKPSRDPRALAQFRQMQQIGQIIQGVDSSGKRVAGGAKRNARKTLEGMKAAVYSMGDQENIAYFNSLLGKTTQEQVDKSKKAGSATMKSMGEDSLPDLTPDMIKSNVLQHISKNGSITREQWVQIRDASLRRGVSDQELDGLESAIRQYIQMPKTRPEDRMRDYR